MYEFTEDCMIHIDNIDEETGKVIMTAAQSREAFKQWIENDSYAKTTEVSMQNVIQTEQMGT